MERSVGIVVHRRSAEALEFARQVIAWLAVRHIVVRLDSEAAVKLGHPTLTCPPEGWKTVEFVITLGGLTYGLLLLGLGALGREE